MEQRVELQDQSTEFQVKWRKSLASLIRRGEKNFSILLRINFIMCDQAHWKSLEIFNTTAQAH